MFLRDYAEDPEKQKDGSPFYRGDTVFYVKRNGTPEARKFLKELQNKLFGPLHKWADNDESVLMAHFIAEYLISGWDNVIAEEGGDPIPYSKKAARMIFLNPDYFLSLNIEIGHFANMFENYLYDSAEDDIENIKKN